MLSYECEDMCKCVYIYMQVCVFIRVDVYIAYMYTVHIYVYIYIYYEGITILSMHILVTYPQGDAVRVLMC